MVDEYQEAAELWTEELGEEHEASKMAMEAAARLRSDIG